MATDALASCFDALKIAIGALVVAVSALAFSLKAHSTAKNVQASVGKSDP